MRCLPRRALPEAELAGQMWNMSFVSLGTQPGLRQGRRGLSLRVPQAPSAPGDSGCVSRVGWTEGTVSLPWTRADQTAAGGGGGHRRELGLTFRGVSGLHGPCKNERLTERKAPECSFLSGPGQREEAVVGDRRWTEASRDGSRSAAGEAPSVASARPGDRAGALRVPGDVRRKAGCKPPPLRAPSTRGDLRPQEPA